MPAPPPAPEQLINAAYDMALDPSLFEQFADAWDQFTRDIEMSAGKFELDDAMQAHFERAFMILQRMGRDTNLNEPLESLLAQREGPCLSVNLDGQVVAANVFASRLLGAELHNMSLPAKVHHKSSASLARGLLEVQVGSGMMPILVMLDDNVPSLFVLRKLPQSGQVLVDITGSVWSTEVSEFLTTTHGLTSAEIEVAKLLYQGMSLQEVADSRHRSKETVRKHLGAVFDKTGCRSQAQLMKLITGVNFARIDEQKPVWFSTRLDIHQHTLSSGRNLAYYDLGASNKKVMVVMHPFLRTPELPVQLEQALLNQNYRLLGICRAGYGDSSPLSGASPVLRTAADDAAELCTALGVDRFSLLGLMGGAIHCYQIASQYPLRVEAITAISGTVPIVDEQQLREMPASTRVMAFSARKFPKIFPFLVRSAVALVDMGDDERLVQSIYGKSEADYRYAQQPEIKSWIVRGSQFAVHHGYATYANEIAAVAPLDGTLVDNLRCPVTLIHSANDYFVTLESVTSFAAASSSIEVRPVADSSHLLLYSHTDEIIKIMT